MTGFLTKPWFILSLPFIPSFLFPTKGLKTEFVSTPTVTDVTLSSESVTFVSNTIGDKPYRFSGHTLNSSSVTSERVSFTINYLWSSYLPQSVRYIKCVRLPYRDLSTFSEIELEYRLLYQLNLLHLFFHPLVPQVHP